MNKYQEAYELIEPQIMYKFDGNNLVANDKEYLDALETIKELINEYDKLLESHKQIERAWLENLIEREEE